MHLLHLIIGNSIQGQPQLLTICVEGWSKLLQGHKMVSLPPAYTLPKNLDLLTKPMRLPEIAKAMKQKVSTVRTSTPVATPPGLLLDTVTWMMSPSLQDILVSPLWEGFRQKKFWGRQGC